MGYKCRHDFGKRLVGEFSVGWRLAFTLQMLLSAYTVSLFHLQRHMRSIASHLISSHLWCKGRSKHIACRHRSLATALPWYVGSLDGEPGQLPFQMFFTMPFTTTMLQENDYTLRCLLEMEYKVMTMVAVE